MGLPVHMQQSIELKEYPGSELTHSKTTYSHDPLSDHISSHSIGDNSISDLSQLIVADLSLLFNPHLSQAHHHHERKVRAAQFSSHKLPTI